MELISVTAAKVIWLVNVVDLNPKGLRIIPQLADALIDAYDFDALPEDAPASNNIKLRNGVFVKDEEEYRVGLEVYDDGFVGESASSTALTEEFLEHAIEWAKGSFNIKFSPDLLMKKIYLSEVVVRFHNPVATAFQAFANFSSILTRKVDAPGGGGFTLNNLTFGTKFPVGSKIKTLSIERRANISPDANIFYCSGPLTTDELLELLGEFDALLAKPTTD